jgi:cellulose synthase operon protein C
MKYHIPIRLILLCLMIQAAALFSGAAPSGSRPDDEFLKEKSIGNYGGALEALVKNSPSLKDPASMEVDIFRIQELMRYPELHDRGLEALEHIAAAAGPQHPFLADRIDQVRAMLYLSKGDIKRAEAIQKSLSCLDFQALGPFQNSSIEDFERSHGPEQTFNRKQLFEGTYGPVSWFPVSPDRNGTISFSDLYPETRHSFFYLARAISVPQAGEYYLICGKTGYTDLWLDGRRIFADRTEHGFCHDQYYIRLHLPAGPHRIVMKAGDSDEGIRISLRIASADGARLSSASMDGGGIAGPAELRGITYFPALAELLAIKDPGPEELFSAGYLFVAARLVTNDNNRGLQYLSGIPEGHPLFSYACYYIARAQKEIEARDRYLNKSIQADPRNSESLRELAGLKISRGFVYEAYPLIDAIQKIRPRSPWYHESMARLFMKQEWISEALRHAAALKNSPFPSAGLMQEAAIYRSDRDYFHAIPDLEQLIRTDAFNLSWHLALVDCYEKTGNRDAAEQALLRMVALNQNNSSLKLRLAGTVQSGRGPVQALPYYTAALKAAPGNRDILKALGMAYHKIGKKDLAVYYLDLSCRHDPGNHALKKYLETIRGDKDDIERYILKDDASTLSAPALKYRDEPAVTILDETVIAVGSDGSFERHVRKIVMINDRSQIRNYSNQYVVLDPGTESAENVSCCLVRNRARIEIAERYHRPLSRPESRLYYNLEALIIPVPSLTPGDIIDFRYVIKNRGSADYRHYFGEKISAGDGNRTLRFRVVVIHPAGKPVYCRLKGIEAHSLSVEKGNRKTVYRVTLDNCPPFKKERAMPDRSEILPAVYFTSHRSWDEFSAWYRSLLKDRIRVDTEMKAAVHKITGDARGPLDRVRAIYGFVTGSIRYVGFEFGIGGIQPRATDATFHTRMGDCKDMSLLLAALLRESGIDARLALIRTRDRGRAHLDVPFAGEFNHAVCYVNLGGGFFLDATVPDSGVKEFPADDRGLDALVMDDTGCKFITTGSGFYDRNLVEITNAVRITKAGDAEFRRSLMKQGESAPAARTGLKDRERHGRSLNEYWNAYFPGSSSHDLTISPATVDEPVRYSYAVTIPGFARVIEKSIIFDAIPIRSDLYQAYALSGTRSFPVVLPGAGTTRTVTNYTIPEGYRVERLPRNDRYTSGAVSASFTYSAGGGLITVESVIELKTALIAISEYRGFREFARLVDKKERERILLAPASP